MKIALLGNFLSPWCTEVHFAHSLRELGHVIVELQETNTPAEQILRDAVRANLFVWVHSHSVQVTSNSVPALTMQQVITELRRCGIPCIAYHLDLYRGIPERWREYREHTYIRSLDHFFTADGPLADWLNTNTDVKGHYLPPGVLAAEAYCAAPTADRFDVGFVGSLRYHPSWPYRRQLIEWLGDTYGTRFRLYGQDAGHVVRGAELNQVYADCRIAIGDSFCPNFDYGPYFSDRLIEAPGRGAFQIAPRVKGITDCFDDGQTVLYDLRDFGQLRELIEHYLGDEEGRERIRLNGHQRVRAEHTYTHRWQTILWEVFGEAVPTREPDARAVRRRMIGIDHQQVVPPSGVRLVRRSW